MGAEGVAWVDEGKPTQYMGEKGLFLKDKQNPQPEHMEDDEKRVSMKDEPWTEGSTIHSTGKPRAEQGRE
jgi:hypothetical protein